MERSMVEKMIKPSFEDVLPMDTSSEKKKTEHSALFITCTDKEIGRIESGTLIPGHIYTLEVKSFQFESAILHGHIDDGIVSSYIKKFYAERETLLVVFTNAGGIQEIVSGLHVIEAANRLGIEYVYGVYAPRSALNSKEVKVIA